MKQLTLFGDDVQLQNDILQNIVRVTDHDIDEAEHQIGYSFPADYREFLRHYGGALIGSGVLVKDATTGSSCSCEVTVFYGINTQHPSYDLVSQYRVGSRYLQSYLLPIAIGDSDPGFAVMSLAGEDRGKVYCYRDLGDEKEMCPLANSFDEFLSFIDPRGDI